MGGRVVHHPTFDTLVSVNREVVALSGEEHGYSEADGRKIEEVASEVERRAEGKDFDEAVMEKGSLLMFRLASGQYFKAGNRRTALVAGTAFLAKNRYSMDISDPELVAMVGRVGVAAATLEELHVAVERATKPSGTERSGWPKVIEGVVAAHGAFLTRMA